MNHFIKDTRNLFNEMELINLLYKYYRPLFALVKTDKKSYVIDTSDKMIKLMYNTILTDIDDSDLYVVENNDLCVNSLLYHCNCKLSIMNSNIKYLRLHQNYIIIADETTIRIINKSTISHINVKYNGKLIDVIITNNIVMVILFLGQIVQIINKYSIENGDQINYVLNHVEYMFIHKHNMSQPQYCNDSIVMYYNKTMMIFNCNFINADVGQTIMLNFVNGDNFHAHNNGIVSIEKDIIHLNKFLDGGLAWDKSFKCPNIKLVAVYENMIILITEDILECCSLSDNSSIFALSINNIKNIKLNTWKEVNIKLNN